MRYCKSLLYGGVLVDAQNANYEDYARLLLRCPNPQCGVPVHLVAAKHREEHTRVAPKSKAIVLVKEHDVPAYWSHFDGIESETCELRVRQITQQDIERVRTQARNQRLRVFQRRFWQIVRDSQHFDSEEQIRALILRLIGLANPDPSSDKYYATHRNPRLTRMLDRLQTIFCERFRACSPDFLNKLAGDLMHRAQTLPAEALAVVDEESNGLGDLLQWLSSLEVDLHLAVVAEAIDYLRTKSAQPILEFLFLYGMQAWYHNEVAARKIKTEAEFAQVFTIQPDQTWDVSEITVKAIGNAIAVLTITRWADGLQNV